MMRSLSIIIFSLLIFSACDEPIRLDLRQTEPKVVIEALITNLPGYQKVKLTRSIAFYDGNQSPRITNATVSVADDAGGEITFVHNPRNHPDSAGYYLPAVPFTGETSRTYTLTVDVDGQTFEATEKMNAIISMDSLGYKINEFQERFPNEEGKIYELLMYAKEPQDEKNFYLFKFYRNDSLTFYNESDIYYTDDALLSGNIDGFPSPVYYGVDDLARVEVFSLGRSGYVFYNDLFSVLNNDGGGMFGPIPSSPRTNLSNGALGYFQVSAVNISEVKIE